jgi:hypothetical protein
LEAIGVLVLLRWLSKHSYHEINRNHCKVLWIESILVNCFKSKLSMRATFLLAVILFSACKKHCDCNTVDRKKKDGEVLYKICKYITDNKLNSEPANPCEFKVRRIEDDTLNGKSIYRVTLNCSYMGDVILIDKQTNEVFSYLPSPK